MFHDIPPKILDRMEFLENKDATDRSDGTPRLQRLRQVPAQTGKFLAIMASCAPKGINIEIGTSGGYSALWIGLACKQNGTKLTTFEILEEKASLAEETFLITGMTEFVELIYDDVRNHLNNFQNIAFCFLDAEKEDYEEFYDRIIPKMTTGGIFLADNAINHKKTLQPMLDKALFDKRMDASIIPIGKGVLMGRKL